MKISEIRAKYPEYSDLSNEQLVIGLHRKFYGDMPFKDFNRRIEYDQLSPSEREKDKNVTLTGKTITPEMAAAWKDAQERPFGSGIPRAAYNLGGTVTDITGSPAAGYATNVLTQAIPALASSYRVMTPEPSMAAGPAKYLMQSALKPGQAARESGDADRAIATMLEEGISPTRGGMSKASALAKKLNKAVNAKIAGSSAQADIPAVVQRLDPLKARATMQVNPEADIAAIDKAVAEFQGSPAISNATSIPVQLAQKLKSGTYTSLGNKAYGELGSASTEAQKQLARGLREEVIAKVPEIAEPLKREAALRNAMEVAASRALQDANKNPLSLGTSIAAIMHDPLSAAGMWANASTPVKALLARMLYTAGKPSSALPAAIAVQEAMNQGEE